MTGEQTPQRTAEDDARSHYRRGVAELLERRAVRPTVLRDILALPLDMASVYSIGDLLQHLRPLTGQPIRSDVFGTDPKLLVRGLHVAPTAEAGRFRFVQDGAGPHQHDVLAAALTLSPGFDDVEVDEGGVTLLAEGPGLRLIAALGEAPDPIAPSRVAPDARLLESLADDPVPYGAMLLDTDRMSDGAINRTALDAVGSVRGRPVTLAVTGQAADRTIARLHRDLTATGLRERAVLLCSGDHVCGIDVIVSAALGADRMTAIEAPRAPLLTDIRKQLAAVGMFEPADMRGRVEFLHPLNHSSFCRETHAGDRVSV